MNTLQKTNALLVRPLLLALLVSTAFAAQVVRCARQGCWMPAYKGRPGDCCGTTCLEKWDTPMCCAGWGRCIKRASDGRPADVTHPGATYCTKICRDHHTPRCPTPGCGRPSWDAIPGELCAWPCPAAAPAVCVTPSCGLPTHNGLDVETCSRICGMSPEQWQEQWRNVAGAVARAAAAAPAPTPSPAPTPAPPATTCTYADAWLTGAAIGKKSDWKVRTYTFNGIMLQDALKFDDATPAAQQWKREFFQSLQNHEWPGKNFYLKWNINKAELTNTSFSWKIVMRPDDYSSKGGNHADPSKFGSRIDATVNPDCIHQGGSNPDLVQVSPGNDDDRKPRQGNDRCMFVGTYMQLTSEPEKTSLWQTCANVATKRLSGKFDRNQVMHWDKVGGSQWGNGVAAMDANGHTHIEINTHGGGVPWLHVRIETRPEYDPEAGRV